MWPKKVGEIFLIQTIFDTKDFLVQKMFGYWQKKFGPEKSRPPKVWSKLGQQQLRLCLYGQMSPGHMFLEQMAP